MKWLLRKGLGIFIVIVGLAAVLMLVLAAPYPGRAPLVYGVSFSPDHAVSLGLDWQEAYQAILTDLGVRRLRLAAYWNQIEPSDDQFDFTTLDYLMDEAAAHEATVILAVGRKLPRWPECHEPGWVQALPPAEQHQQLLEMVRVVVERYHDHPSLYLWQLENEPLLDFGTCPPFDPQHLHDEEAMIRSLDNHPMLVTDSGELNSWLPAAAFGDVFGTTIYRTVFSQRTHELFHYDYLFPAWLYRLKGRLVRLVHGKSVIISELQGEPWGRVGYQELDREERRQSFSPERFGELATFAVRTQFPEAYWWGVEYWYWEKTNGDPAFWEMAREYF